MHRFRNYCAILINMKKIVFTFVAVAMILVLAGCGSSKNIPYFQNIDTISLAASRGLYDAHIMPKDMLTINVHTTDAAASAPFNLSAAGASSSQGTTASATSGYLVDNNGNINFPIVGKIHVAGLTKGECEDLIKSKIQPYLSRTENPVITVRMSSYRVTVIGEVGSPGVIPVATEKMSIIEALAEAGDLTIYGKRDNVMLIREDAQGQKSMHRINLNDASIINSPYYYLQQNDVIYVEPNKAKAKDATISNSTSLWMSMVSILVSVASMVVNIVR